MLTGKWRELHQKTYRWVLTLERIFKTLELPALNGPIIYIFSDYSGQHKTSNYEVVTTLYVDLQGMEEWEVNRRRIRKLALSDGRRMSFKALNDRKKQKALVPFLSAADSIAGILVSLIINKAVHDLCVGVNDFEIAKQSLRLGPDWTLNNLEHTLRVVHLVSLLIGGLSFPHQAIYWISDEDSLFANTKRSQNLSAIIGKISSIYVRHELGELGLGTTAMDPGDRFEEDATAIADLTAGGWPRLPTPSPNMQVAEFRFPWPSLLMAILRKRRT